MIMSLADALRVEIQKVLDEGPFTIQTAMRIERIADAAKSVLAAAGGVAAAIERVKTDQTADENPIAYSSAAETFGARMVQEIVAVLPQLLGARTQQSPEALVHALVMARLHGMTDVAAELETKLVGRPLDGERPVFPPGEVMQPVLSGVDDERPDAIGLAAGNGTHSDARLPAGA